MPLPVYPNEISLGLVNTELGYASSTQSITLNDAAVRTLFVKSSGAIAMSDGHGKSAVTAPVITANPSAFVWTAGGKTISYSNANHTNLEYLTANNPHILVRDSDLSATEGSLYSSPLTITYSVSGTNNVYRWQHSPSLPAPGGYYSDVRGTAESVNNVSSPGSGGWYSDGFDSPQFYNASPQANEMGWYDNPSNGTGGDRPVVSNTSTLSITQRAFASAAAYYNSPDYNGQGQFIFPPLPDYNYYTSQSSSGWWRLKVSNSAGTIYSGWTKVEKRWARYTYSCNCTTGCTPCNCTGGCDTCYDECCDENNENCEECNPHDCYCTTNCDDCDCTTGCSQCAAWAGVDEGGTAGVYLVRPSRWDGHFPYARAGALPYDANPFNF